MAANSDSRKFVSFSDNFVISTPDIKKVPTESLGWTLFTNLKLYKDNIGQIDVKTDQKETFGSILQRSVRTALHMRKKHIVEDDVISLCTWNHLNAVIPYIASLFLGARVAPLDPSFSLQEMTYLLKLVKPKMLFIIPEVLPTIEKILKDEKLNSEIIVFGYVDNYTSFDYFLQPDENEDVFEPVKIDDLKKTTLIHFSSGTTGLPKGICLNHFGFLGQMFNTKIPEEIDEEYVKNLRGRIRFPGTRLCYTSLYWLSGSGLLTGSILEGTCRLVCSKFDPKEIWNLIEKYKPSTLTLTPIQIMEMLDHRRFDIDVDCVFGIIIIGSAISTEYFLKIKDIFPKTDVLRGYGQTEVSDGLTMFNPLDILSRAFINNEKKTESVGLPLRGITYRVVDLDTGKNLGPNQTGELRVKTDFIMNGYYNTESKETFDEDGWLKTGDLVYYDQDFCFYIVDRIKEAFKYQGWFVTPTLIENALFDHPAVKNAVVVGVPKNDGHHAIALVVLRDGFDVAETEIEKFVEERVPERQKLRAGVRFVQSLPLTATGKINRRKVKQILLEEQIK